MLLTITYRGPNASDLGFLLHKNPQRPQRFALSWGCAYVFYPKVCQSETTAALLLDIDPVELARGKAGSRDGGLFDYVNDRPYVASSFLSTAIVNIFSSAMAGRCRERPELVQQSLDLEANLSMLPCSGGEEMAQRVFAPLGYRVSCTHYTLDEQFPTWGESRYIQLTLRATVRLNELLNHLYVLIPVFDGNKHYWIDQNEVEKLLRHGAGWLSEHPDLPYITRRYFSRKRSLANQAIARLEESGPETDATDIQEAAQESSLEGRPNTPSLNATRLCAVAQAIQESGAHYVIDLGCGEGRLLSLLLEEKQLQRVTGVDVSTNALERAKRRLHLERMAPVQRARLTLLHGSLTYRDQRFEGYDTACAVEVIEHLDPCRLPAFEQVVFQYAAPATVIITTPNAEYNINYEGLKDGSLRHSDHRFEWTRTQFQDWAAHICSLYGYSVAISGIGAEDGVHGAPTQMGVFQKCG